MNTLKEITVNNKDCVKWSLHPEFIEGAIKAQVYFVFGYAHIRALSITGEILYDEYAN